MDVNQALPLLGGISPQTFMRRFWQKKPLLVRQAVPGIMPVPDRAGLFDLAAQQQVESRLVARPGALSQGGWRLRHGPFGRRALPPLKRPGWTLLVQGVDLHVEAARALLDQFRFVPDARLDDVMVSYASDGGGVGPHFDSYDVFLLQVLGQRRWRIGRQKELALVPGMPLKILSAFEAEQEFVLDPGDMLYLPPRYAHDGVAIGECMTYSVGFKAPGRGDLAAEMLQRLAQDAPELAGDALYRDAGQQAVQAPAAVPEALAGFARTALQRVLQDPAALQRALGESLTEPKASVWFVPVAGAAPEGALRLDRKTRMMYDPQHVFINGESFRAGGRDAVLMRALADRRELPARDVARLSAAAGALVRDWCEAGWLHGV